MSRAVLWSAVEAVVGGGLSIVSAFVIARLIGPEELGIGAAAVAAHVVFWVALNGLLSDALVQRPTIDRAIISSAFWCSASAGVIGMIVLAGIGYGLAAQLSDARLAGMGLALAATLPLVGFAGIAQGLLTRRKAYRALALRTILGQGSGIVIGIGSALTGAEAWALVWQQVATTAVGALVLLFVGWYRPALSFRWHHARALLAVGLPLTGSTLTQIARYRVFAVLLGAVAGPAVLGQAHMAFRLVDTVRDLAFTALWRLLLPDLSRFQHDRAAMLARVDRLLTLCCLAILPLCLAQALTLVPLTRLALGPGWAEAGIAALPLTALMALMALTFPSGVALIAFGQARFTLYGNLAALALCVLGVLLLRPGSAWDAVLTWCASQAAVVPYALWVNGRALGVGPWRVIRSAITPGGWSKTGLAWIKGT